MTVNIAEQDRWDPEPRWPAAIAVLAVGGLYLALPASLTVGPRWLFPGVIAVLLVPTMISHHAGKPCRPHRPRPCGEPPVL